MTLFGKSTSVTMEFWQCEGRQCAVIDYYSDEIISNWSFRTDWKHIYLIEGNNKTFRKNSNFTFIWENSFDLLNGVYYLDQTYMFCLFPLYPESDGTVTTRFGQNPPLFRTNVYLRSLGPFTFISDNARRSFTFILNNQLI